MVDTELIAVTGANGFLGTHIVEQLLASGTKTKAIVRSKQSASALEAKHSTHVQSKLLEFAFVPDISTHGPVYDEAFHGVTGLIHTASPIFELGGKTKDKEAAFLKPAIFGALNAMEAAHRTPSIKKVVFTSSVVAATPPEGKGTISNTYFPPTTYEQAANFEQDRDTYGASKTLAEKAVWDFVKKNNPKFEFTTMLIGLLIGNNISGKSENTGSNSIAVLMVKAPQSFISFPLITVQDAAAAHISALKPSKTDGKRILVVEKIVFSRDAVQLAKDNVSDFPAGALLPLPESGQYLDVDKEQIKQAEQLLDLTFTRVDDAYVKLLRDNV